MSRSECDAIRPLISAALDGDLDEEEFVQLSGHLAACDACQQVHHDYAQLRDDLKSAPQPTPPPQIAKNVWKETVDKPPPPAIIRLASRTGVRFGMSTMAASVVAVLVAVLFVAHGYDQRSIPSVASSQPTQEAMQEWPVSQPIEIEFSKQMNRSSVMENLIIWPTAEQDRLPTSWSGNTLIIGRSEDHSVLLRPETDYRITILEHAEDRHGNAIGDFWVLQFRTGPPDVAIATPSPTSNNSDVSDDSAESDDRVSVDNWFFGGNDNGDEEEEAEATEPEAAEESGEPDSPPAEDGEGGEYQLVPTEEPEPSDEPETGDESDDQSPDPTVTPEPEPTEAEPTPKPTETDPTPEPTETESTPEPTPEPTEPPAPEVAGATEDAEPFPVRGGFGEVYWGKDDIRQALGEPVESARTFLASEQEFQRGMMFRQHYQDRNAILAFVNGSNVRAFDHTGDSTLDDGSGEERDDGLFIPSGYFGQIWNDQSDLAQEIGYAVSADPVENVDAAIQQFSNGTLIFSRGSVYVLHSDGTWDVFPVRSGGFHGDDPDHESDDGSSGEESPADEGDEDSSDEEDPAEGDDDGGNEDGDPAENDNEYQDDDHVDSEDDAGDADETGGDDEESEPDHSEHEDETEEDS